MKSHIPFGIPTILKRIKLIKVSCWVIQEYTICLKFTQNFFALKFVYILEKWTFFIAIYYLKRFIANSTEINK